MPFVLGNFEGKGHARAARRHSAVSCAKLNGSKCRLRCGLGWVQGSMCDMAVHIGATCRIYLNRPCAAAMQPFCQITLTTHYDYYCHNVITATVCNSQTIKPVSLSRTRLIMVTAFLFNSSGSLLASTISLNVSNTFSIQQQPAASIQFIKTAAVFSLIASFRFAQKMN